ncbi:uncharacterized protein LOC134782012 [Penaeus indicus]|uniref:uncharacterized protein LOC134782012 n=1 Tax=Penaeus indicus TaxID=29960 RepID=UPI00300CBABF
MWTKRKFKIIAVFGMIAVYAWLTLLLMTGPKTSVFLRNLESLVHVTSNISSEEPNMEEILFVPPTLSPEEKIRRVEKASRNLPIGFAERSHGKKKMNNSCAHFPSVYDIHYNNMYWQTVKTSNGKFHFYGAYYDNRTLEPDRPVVRITAIINRVGKFAPTICQIWFEDLDEPVFSESSRVLVWYKEWGHYNNHDLNPYIITCKIPASHQHLVPQAVSLVERHCDYATNLLKVIYNLPEDGQKEGFAVCVKGSEFYTGDMTVRLIEWLELHFAMGANKIFYYDFGMNRRLTKTMEYYTKKGLVEVIPLTLPDDQPNIPGLVYKYLDAKFKYQHEVIPYNDCYYRNIYRYRYTVHADPDEIIIPRNANSWHELMDIIVKKSQKDKVLYTSYSAPHTFYMDEMLPPEGYFKDIPKYMHIMQHAYRSANYTPPGASIKCFHDTERALGLHNHFPIHCLGGQYNCRSYFISPEDAQMQHYRKTCQGFVQNCYETYKKNTVLDPTAWKFKDEVMARVNRTLAALNYFRNSPL